MAKSLAQRERRRANQTRRNIIEKENLDDQIEEVGIETPEVEIAPVLSVEEKDYDYPMSSYPTMGPTSYEELDAAEEAREQARAVNEETWNVQTLVSNIAYSAMTPEAKSKAIVNVGKGFGSRLNTIVKKEIDIELIELQALVARDSRHTSVIEKAGDFIANTFASPSVDSKTYIRRQLKDTIKTIENGNLDLQKNLAREGIRLHDVVRDNIPALIKKAKEAGIGNTPNSVIIEKDASGTWRAVMWPSNNFMDLDGEILAEVAHKEYVDWVNENMDCAPAFVIGHTPGTARESAVDFVGYENGYLIMSAPLTEKEAADLLRMQIVTDIGMSHGTLVLERDPANKKVITKYRMVEVSDLPLERAANPFTDFDVLSKEAHMNVPEYLKQMLGEEKAAIYLAKTAAKQENLRDAGVKEKEVTTPTAPTTVVNNNAPVDLTELVEKLSKELGMEELSETIARLQEAAEKVPVLEGLVKELATSKEDDLAEMIEAPVKKSLSWMTTRPTQKADNVLEEGKPEDDKLKKSAPTGGWLAEAVGVEPIHA